MARSASMNPGLERQIRDDFGFPVGELSQTVVHGVGVIVEARELSEELGVARLGPREIAVETLQGGRFEVRCEKLEALVGAGLDEAEDEKAVGEPTLVGSREGHELLGVGVALVAAEGEAALEDTLVHGAEVLQLFHGESTHAPHELVALGIAGDEGHRRRCRFFLAVGVVDEDGVHVRRRHFDPTGSGLHQNHDPL